MNIKDFCLTLEMLVNTHDVLDSAPIMVEAHGTTHSISKVEIDSNNVLWIEADCDIVSQRLAKFLELNKEVEDWRRLTRHMAARNHIYREALERIIKSNAASAKMIASDALLGGENV